MVESDLRDGPLCSLLALGAQELPVPQGRAKNFGSRVASAFSITRNTGRAAMGKRVFVEISETETGRTAVILGAGANESRNVLKVYDESMNQSKW